MRRVCKMARVRRRTSLTPVVCWHVTAASRALRARHVSGACDGAGQCAQCEWLWATREPPRTLVIARRRRVRRRVVQECWNQSDDDHVEGAEGG